MYRIFRNLNMALLHVLHIALRLPIWGGQLPRVAICVFTHIHAYSAPGFSEWCGDAWLAWGNWILSNTKARCPLKRMPKKNVGILFFWRGDWDWWFCDKLVWVWVKSQSISPLNLADQAGLLYMKSLKPGSIVGKLVIVSAILIMLF